MIHIISRFYIMDWAFATVNSADSTSPVIKLNKIRYVNNHNSGTTPLAKVVQTTNLFKGYLLASSYDSMRYYLQDSNAGAYGSANNEGGNSNLPFGLDILDPPTLYSGTPGGVLTSTAVW